MPPGITSDFVALADCLGEKGVAMALQSFDALYPQPNGQSPLQQLQVQLAHPQPYDLEGQDLREYQNLQPRWHDWDVVRADCAQWAIVLFDRLNDDTDTHP